MKRLFIGLNLKDDEKREIAYWRSQYLDNNFKSVASNNFHITLSFVGLIEDNKLPNLIEAISKIVKPKCFIHLNQLDCWHKPQVLFLTSSSADINLQKLASNIIDAVKLNGIFQQDRIYVPHLTLCRKAKETPAVDAQIDFRFSFDQCHLFESVSTDSGVQYNIIHTWPLS